MKLAKRLLKSFDKRRGRFSATTYLSKYQKNPVVETGRRVEIAQMFYNHDGRDATKWDHYFEIYEKELGPFRGQKVRLLEIGVQSGGSLQLWKKYLGEKVTVFGVDIDPSCKNLETQDLQVRIGSQGNPVFLQEVIAEMGGVDIVIDDGSHFGHDQITSFGAIFPLLSEGGVYLIEDVATAYWREYAGGLGRAGTIITFAKEMIDDLNGCYHGRPPNSLPDAKESIGRITFYDSIIVIAKAHRTPPVQVFSGSDCNPK